MVVRPAAGYSLMEVLVALLVLSAGVIGAVSLQLASWQLAQQSAFHTAAHQLASEMAEWLRIYRGNLPPRLHTLEIDDEGVGAEEAVHCYGTSCTPDQLVIFMVADWQARLKAALPDVQARICRDADPWDSTASAYRWDCTESDSEVPLVIKIAWMDKQALKKPAMPITVIIADT